MTLKEALLCKTAIWTNHKGMKIPVLIFGKSGKYKNKIQISKIGAQPGHGIF